MTSLHNAAKFKMENIVSSFKIAGWNILVYTRINLPVNLRAIDTHIF